MERARGAPVELPCRSRFTVEVVTLRVRLLHCLHGNTMLRSLHCSAEQPHSVSVARHACHMHAIWQPLRQLPVSAGQSRPVH